MTFMFVNYMNCSGEACQHNYVVYDSVGPSKSSKNVKHSFKKEKYSESASQRYNYSLKYK